MIKIIPDKEGKLTQWDLNRKVIVTGYEGVAEVHFASPGDDHGAYVVKLVDGQAEIPNILLTMAGTINVYVYPADRTVFATTLWVMAREKPDDYVYTETEVLNWRTLDEEIGDLAKLTTTAKENLVAAINEAATKGTASIYMRVAEGYIEYSGDGVNWKQLIAVAELKGEKGDKGDPGAQGIQGIQGEKGDKGDKGDPGSDATVDIVTPTAESTDTQAASAKAVWDMLGGGGGSGGGNSWEQFYTQTISEVVSSVVIALPEKYKRLWLIFEVVTTSGSNATLDLRFSNEADGARLQISKGGQTVQGRPTQVYIEKVQGHYPFILFSANSGGNTPGVNSLNPSNPSAKKDWDSVLNSVTVYVTNTEFAVGSKLMFWGCES